MTQLMNRKRILIGFLLAGIFLYLFLRNINLFELWNTVRKGNPYWLLLSGFLAFFNYFVRAVRWRFFFDPIKKTSLNNLFRTTIIGFAISTIFPAKIGEVVRPYLLGTKENISKSTAMATVVVERVFDSASILFLLVIYLVFLVRTEQLSPQAQSSLSELNRAGVILFAGVLGLVLFLYYLKTKPVMVRKIIGKIERFLPAKIAHSIDDILDSFIQGLSILHDPKILWKISYYSIGFWLLICAGFWAGVHAYYPNFAFFSTFLVMTLLALGVAVPTPGGIGSYHLACQLGLTRFFNVPEAQASAIALVSHALAFIPMTILGLIFLWQEGLSTRKIQKIAQKEPEATEPSGASNHSVQQG
jgi:glycosyltransferase 2 family protein